MRFIWKKMLIGSENGCLSMAMALCVALNNTQMMKCFDAF